MSPPNPAWLTALSLVAPIAASLIVSFGVLYFSNKHQAKILNAQHDLSLEKERIAATVAKAEELYDDIQLRKRHLEVNAMKWVALFMQCKSKSEFLDKINADKELLTFDLVRMELNVKAYFTDLENNYREAVNLIHEVGAFQAEMISQFQMSADEKRALNSRLIKAERLASQSLEELSNAVATRIGEVLRLKNAESSELVGLNAKPSS